MADNRGKRPNTGSRKKKNKNNKLLRNIIIGVEAVVLIAVIIILVFVFRTTDEQTGVTKIDLPDADIVINVPEDDPVVQEVRKGYTTLAFFGVDARNGTLQKGTRTDTIIICAINNDTGEARLCSVYRDTYLNIGTMEKPSYQKCNAAYAYGGPEQALNMLNENLDLYITKFVTVGFDGVMRTVDAVGGVDIDIQQNEIKFLNDYQASMYSTETNTVITDDYIPVTETGMQTLSGYQALAYCRIRYTAGSDFKRTERQRDVVQQIVDKAKRMDPATVVKIVSDEKILKCIATNMDLNEDIIPMASEVNKYSVVDSKGFPFEDKITTGMIGPKGDCVIPLDLKSNVEDLHKFLYPDIEYTPSETVTAISDKVASDTNPYLGR